MGAVVSLPHTCPHCGAPFGWGPDVAFLSVVMSAPFDEPAPCCGRRLVGTVGRDGIPQWHMDKVAL